MFVWRGYGGGGGKRRGGGELLLGEGGRFVDGAGRPLGSSRKTMRLV